jgi:hypothetical protein
MTSALCVCGHLKKVNYIKAGNLDALQFNPDAQFPLILD